MSKHIVKCFFALLVVTLITSCKLAIITPTGGDVTSQSGGEMGTGTI